jgi:hypothetical protein
MQVVVVGVTRALRTAAARVARVAVDTGAISVVSREERAVRIQAAALAALAVRLLQRKGRVVLES